MGDKNDSEKRRVMASRIIGDTVRIIMSQENREMRAGVCNQKDIQWQWFHTVHDEETKPPAKKKQDSVIPMNGLFDTCTKRYWRGKSSINRGGRKI